MATLPVPRIALSAQPDANVARLRRELQTTLGEARAAIAKAGDLISALQHDVAALGRRIDDLEARVEALEP